MALPGWPPLASVSLQISPATGTHLLSAGEDGAIDVTFGVRPRTSGFPEEAIAVDPNSGRLPDRAAAEVA
jgi:hypothetical protein